jgi:alkaline phosphatase D
MNRAFDAGRRRFLNRVTLAAGTIAASPLVAYADGGDHHEWRGVRRLIRPGRMFFPQSVASFEPRTRSIIVWSRLKDADYPGQDLDVTLLVSTDPWLRQVSAATRVSARAADDGVMQVKLTELKAKTHYYFRFVYQKGSRWYGSPIGRTRTAPQAHDASPARFVLANCQDAVGRFYNPYLAVLVQDPDFVLHVGDYIYETTGDPSFQVPGGRRPELSDLAGAIRLGTDAAPFYAAASVSNYRELYQFYRSDPALQRVHERFAFVNIWDDHEYANDSWQARSTDFDGRVDENNVQRRRNAEQVFYEYIAVDDGDLSEGQVDLPRPVFPDGKLYRDFRYGKNLHVLLTDSRSYRPDHLIPEDAFPGTVPVDRAALTALLNAAGIPYDAVKASFSPYIDVTAAGLQPVLVAVLTGAYQQQGLAQPEALARAQAVAQGNLDVRVVNPLLAAAGLPPIPISDALDRGISFAHMGKTGFFSSLGSRYVVVKDTYDLYAAFRGAMNPASQDVYDGARAPAHPQLEWLTSVLQSSDARWKVVANSTSLTPMVLDLTGQTPGLPPAIQAALAQLPPELRNRFYLNVDQLDGFPNFKRALLQLYAQRGDVALVAGDIHASFAAEHPGGVWEFTGPAASSFAFRSGVLNTVLSDPVLSEVPGIADLVAQLDLFLRLGNSEVRHVDTGVNGFVVMEATPRKLSATYWEIDGAEATRSYYEHPLRLIGKLRPRRFEVAAQPLAGAFS